MKSLKKVLAAIIAMSAAVSSLALSVSAAEFTGSVKVAAYVFEMEEWQKKVSEVVEVSDYGTYTVSITGISVPVDMVGSLYLKDYDFETVNEGLGNASNVNSDIIINTKSFKLNGIECQLIDGYATELNDKGVFEVTYMNTWGDSYVDASGIQTIESVEITFEVTDADGAGASIANDSNDSNDSSDASDASDAGEASDD